jgi:hypothetical protein
VTVLAGAPVLAEPAVQARGPEASAPKRDERWQLRLRYGVAIRQGAETDSGPGLSYSGYSPNDLAFAGWLWLLLGDHLGLTAGAQREAFSLVDQGSVVTSGGLLRAHVGPTGRVRLGPVRLEAAASYMFQQLPVFGTVDAPAFSAVQRHGVLLAARGLVDLGPVTLEGRFEYPLALAHVGRAVGSRGLGAGGGLRVQLFRTGNVKWGLLADAQWHQDTLENLPATDALVASQSVVRAGLAVDLQWKEPTPDERPKPARLLVRVRGDAGPLASAAVTVQAGDARRELLTDAQGEARVDDLEAGEIAGAARAAGYLRAEGRVRLEHGAERTLELLLPRERPKVGTLRVTVVSLAGKAPVAAALEVNGQAVTADAAGLALVPSLPPGPVVVKASAPGFKPGEEAASIVAFKETALTLTLVPEKQVVPATVSGHVRSARGGKPVAATLEIRELKRTLTADEAGAFSTQLPGGKYTIRIFAPRFVPQTKTVIVRDGDQAIFNVDLSPK